MTTNRRFLAGVIPVAAVTGALATSLVLGGGKTVTAQQITPALTPEQRSVATSLEGAFMRIADTVGPATVRITAKVAPAAAPTGGDGSEDLPNPFGDLFGQPGPGGSGNNRTFRIPLPGGEGGGSGGGTAVGSGVIIRADGYILTNDHVVEDSRDGKVTVTLSDNSTYTGTVFRDPQSDLAVVKINAPKPLPFVRIADSSALHVGQWAVAIGSPYEQQNTMTTGIVSALHRNRTIPDAAVSGRYYFNLIQTDASINPGNSGGPLLNINGELIGINVAILSRSGGSAGIGFAIPANTAKFVADQLIGNASHKVTRGALGITPTDIPAFLRAQIGTDKGAYVKQINAGSPADKAGVQPGDVVTRLGNRDITDEITLREAVNATTPGTAVPVTLLRGGKTVTVTAQLVDRNTLSGNRPDTPTPAKARPVAAQLGFVSRPITADLASRVGLPEATKGLVVTSVTPGSVAAEAGLERGSVITSVNRAPVTTVEALNRATSAAKPGDILTLAVLLPGDGGRAVVNIQVP